MTEREIATLAFAVRREQEKLGKHVSWKEALRLAREKLERDAKTEGRDE